MTTAVNWTGTQPGAAQFGDFLFGPGTPWRWASLVGWEDTPGIDSGTVLRASEHGAWPGTFYAQTRLITADLLLHSEPGQMHGEVRRLAAATPIDASDESPLVFLFDDETPLVVFARCIRRSVAVTRTNRMGLAKGSIQWEASDPRKYSVIESTAITSQPVPEAGLSWPLSWPLAWGTPGSTGNANVVNSGDAPSHPMLTITGPCTRPSVTNFATGAILEYDISLSNTDILYIDTAQGTVTLNGTEANRLYTATLRSVPEGAFVLPPGTSSVAYRSADHPSDPASTLQVTWRSAFW